MARLTQKSIIEILPSAEAPTEKHKTVSEIAKILQIEDEHQVITAIWQLEKRRKVQTKGQKKTYKEVCGIQKSASNPAYCLTT